MPVFSGKEERQIGCCENAARYGSVLAALAGDPGPRTNVDRPGSGGAGLHGKRRRSLRILVGEGGGRPPRFKLPPTLPIWGRRPTDAGAVVSPVPSRRSPAIKRFLTRRRLIAAVAVVGVLAVAGLVFADWLTSGSGSGYAKAGANQSLSTIDVSASATTLPNKLYPGADGDVLIQIHNPNPFPVTVTDITAR